MNRGRRSLTRKLRLVTLEGDTIIGGNHLGAIATYVDKASKFLVTRVMNTRTAAELNQASQEAFVPIPASHLKTFTFVLRQGI